MHITTGQKFTKGVPGRLQTPRNKYSSNTPPGLWPCGFWEETNKNPMGTHHRFKFNGQGLKVKMNQ